MNFFGTIAILILLNAAFCTAAYGKSWRGIVPLRSTRAEVERILGKPSETAYASSYLNLPEYLVIVEYQVNTCPEGEAAFGLGWKVPKDTVTELGLIPKRDASVQTFLKTGDFKQRDDNPGFVYFTDETNGFEIETYNGRVTLLSYMPEKAQEQLRCPRVQECCIDVFPRFDEYANIPFSEEKARLDNFLIQMRNENFRGAIVVYGGGPAARRKLLKRAARAKNYLVKIRGLEAPRLLIVEGGYQKELLTELRLYSIVGLGRRMIFFPVKDPAERH